MARDSLERLVKERDAYRQALMAGWKKESRLDVGSDFDPADCRFTWADIFAERYRKTNLQVGL